MTDPSYPPPQSAAQPEPAPYGSAPAAGGPVGAGPAPGTDLGADLSAALTFAWSAFTRNLGAFLGASAVWFVVFFIVIGGGTVGFVAYMATVAPTTSEPSGGQVLIAWAIITGASLVTGLLAMVWQAGVYRGGVSVVNGGRATFGQVLIGSGNVLLTVLLTGVIAGIGSMLCYLPGLVASLFLLFAVPAAAMGVSPFRAIGQSFALVKENFLTSFIGWLILGVATTIAAIGITLIVLVPLIALFQLGLYQRLTGQQLPDPQVA